MFLELKERIEELAVELTRQRSVTETDEEQFITEKIFHFFSDKPYYQKHPEDLMYIPLENDPWNRKSMIAILRGQKRPTDQAVVLIGHTDTVGISDYGSLSALAHQPYQLTESLKKIKESLTEEVREDLESGDYLFGRGIFDMKTGDAIIMAIMEYIEQHLDEFEGNIIFAAVCDEEANSKGMLSCVPKLLEIQQQNRFDYQAVIDTDYMTGRFPGDEQKYVYTGTVGKLMPSFFIVGKEAHVGEAFEGLDPNQLSSELVRHINMNTAFCDVAEGEATLPPISLKQQDLKPEYSVQTAGTAQVFFNYATHHSTPDQVIEKMKEAAEQSFESVIKHLNDQYRNYNELIGRAHDDLPWKSRVLTYHEWIKSVEKEVGENLYQELDAYAQALLLDQAVDERDFSLKMVEKIHQMSSNQEPLIIVYFTPPYYPHVHVERTEEKGRHLLKAVDEAIVSAPTSYEIKQKKFFPYISDLSFAAAPGRDSALQSLSENMPGYGVKYKLPLKEMRALQLPVVNIGPYGKDAHQFTERIEKRYSFEVVPQIVYQTILNLLKH